MKLKLVMSDAETGEVLRSLVDLVEETPDLKRAMGVVPALREREKKEENEK